jgi:hypothetical protein
MTRETNINRQLTDHINYGSGTKTVCVSTCLNYLGIAPDQYNYTSSKTNCTAYENVLRKHGYAVRSRISEFKVKKFRSTMTELKQAIRKSSYTQSDLFLVSGVQMKCAHLMILNGEGEVVIDTAPKKKWKIKSVRQVFRD